MKREFRQIEWDARTADDCRQVVRLAVREDLDRFHDLTTLALVPAGSRGTADAIVRQRGVVAGLPAAQLIVEEMNLDVALTVLVEDGAEVQAGARIARFSGAARDLLTAERTILNYLGRLSGIATLTHKFVERVAGYSARIYDTRKTTPGWRRLEKYAVRCGGGRNHRSGLFDAVLIKDNHLAQAARQADVPHVSLAAAVEQVRQFLRNSLPEQADAVIEVEVDTLDQLDEVLTAHPDIVLLDNMSVSQLQEAVRRRNERGLATELEASGGVSLATVREIAATGVERISVGSLTHSAATLDIGLDWVSEPLQRFP